MSAQKQQEQDNVHTSEEAGGVNEEVSQSVDDAWSKAFAGSKGGDRVLPSGSDAVAGDVDQVMSFYCAIVVRSTSKSKSKSKSKSITGLSTPVYKSCSKIHMKKTTNDKRHTYDSPQQGGRSVRHLVAGTHQHKPIWNERWPRNGPGSIWMSDDSDDDELTEPVQIHIRGEDLIDAHGHDQQMANAEQAYQTVKDRSAERMNQTGRPRRAAKDKANLGLKVYKAWCKGTTAKSARKGPNHQCTVTDNIDRFI